MGDADFDHDGTKRRRIGNEDKPATQISLPRDPQPVAEDDVGRPAQKSDFRGFRRGKFGNFKVEADFLVESPALMIASSQPKVPVFCTARRSLSAATASQLKKTASMR